ncbi:winged helix-turn-helix domain-containing protein [Microbispora triticiradicis]|uniref:winged helix-turn-helix domain-containing protein n=1 Tax=Microbispora triticiradicis TaxID=2200763 RepID=UPI001AD6CB80|nr:winged helix-turn-helix domain-containing protein [Microbispora triticiradicis]MBO4270410.1 GntR family transcriptional regulator [Microbispora triticiradicis]
MEFPPDVYVWQAVADEIKRRIKAGQYQPRMPIPAERRMAEEFGVAVNTVRRAVAVLREEGVLMTLPAKGTFVAPIVDVEQDPSAD